MINWKLINRILTSPSPPLPGVEVDREEHLPPEGLTMGTLFIGRQGTGKTSCLARHIVNYFVKYPGRAIFVLDWSGSISNMLLTLILQNQEKDKLLKRIVYDELGRPDFIIPMPEFSPSYLAPYEEQVQRVATNMVKLSDTLVTGAPYLAGLGLREIAPQIFRLLTAIENEHGECWQITEAKRLILELPLLKLALRDFGYKVTEAKWFLCNFYSQLKSTDRDLKVYAILGILGAIEPRETKARVGYYRPGWTPKEAIDKGLVVLVDGSRLINQKNSQHYLFTQVYSLIMAEINKRIPANPSDQPIALVMDEVYSLLSIPGMAEEIGMLSPLYRSRKLELYIVLQALSQLAPSLRNQIWSIGNIISFAVSNMDEAYELAQQIFKYESQTIKMPAKTETGQPIVEPDRGQYLEIANKIQRFKHRELIMRRYLSEKVLDSKVRYVPKTKDNPEIPISESVEEIKEFLLKQRGVEVRNALEIISKRNLNVGSSPPRL